MEWILPESEQYTAVHTPGAAQKKHWDENYYQGQFTIWTSLRLNVQCLLMGAKGTNHLTAQ